MKAFSIRIGEITCSFKAVAMWIDKFGIGVDATGSHEETKEIFLKNNLVVETFDDVGDSNVLLLSFDDNPELGYSVE